MYIAILLILGFILVYIIKPKDKESYRKTVLSLFGIAYFSLWRFIDFYLNIFPTTSIDKNIVFLFLIILVFIISFLPWVTRSTPVKAYSYIAVFVVSVVITFTFEREIKNIVADLGGYYHDPEYNFSDETNKSKVNTFYYKAGGFKLNVPTGWLNKTNDSGLVYFIQQSNNKKTAELRPRCFHNTDLTMPEIVNNIISTDKTQGAKTEKHCSIENKKLLTCFIRSNNTKSNMQERWRWLVMNKENHQNAELDIVFYSNNVKNKQEVNKIISSFEMKTLAEPLPYCASTIEWY